MTVYSYSRVLVWDNLGGSVKVARNQRVDVTDPATGLVAAGLTVKGQPVSYVTSDGDGHVTFASTMGLVRLTSARGFWQDVESPDLRSGAVQAGIDAAAAAASAAASATAATGAATAAATQATAAAKSQIDASAASAASSATSARTAASDATAAAKSQIDASAAAAASSATAAQNSAALVGAPAKAAMDAAMGGDVARVVPNVDELGINVKARGAKGDGTTDDTATIQAAINAAATFKLPVYLPAGTYNVTTLLPKSGVRIFSRGATLKATANSGEGILATTLGTAVDDWGVEGVTFDCNGVTRRAVFVRGSRVSIIGNRVLGLANPAVSQCAIRLYWDSTDCIVERNHITLGVDNPFGTFPSLIGIQITGNQNGLYAGLDTSNDVVRGTNYPRANQVKDNRVYGGTHGIMLSATTDNLVQGNWCEMQAHRNIILSPEASGNDVSGNMCRQFGSAGIHLAYASDGNHIHGNTIYSDGTFMIAPTGGEGAIQAYVHCQDNRIEGNRIRTKSTRFGVYSAIFCNGTAIENNDVEWTLQAGVAVESDWSATPAAGQNYARPNYVTPPNAAWTSWDNGKGMTQISIRNNRVRRSQLGVVNAGIYVSQVGTAALSSVTIEGNLIDSQNTSGHDLYVYTADATKFTNSTVDRNMVQPVEVLQNTFYNAATKLTSYLNNSWQGRNYNVTAGTTVVDWAASDFRTINAADTITSFTGLLMDANFNSRTITLRLFAGAKVNHGATCILKGGAQATATTNDDTITFRVVGGSAREISRNF